MLSVELVLVIDCTHDLCSGAAGSIPVTNVSAVGAAACGTSPRHRQRLSAAIANYLFGWRDEAPEILGGHTLRVTLRNSFPLVDFGLLPLVAQVHEEEKDLFVFAAQSGSK